MKKFAICIAAAFLVALIGFVCACSTNSDCGLPDGDSDQVQGEGEDDGGGIDGDQDSAESSDGEGDGDTESSDGDSAEMEGAEEEDEAEIELLTLELEDGCSFFATSDECLLPYPSFYFEKSDDSSSTGVRGNYPQGILPNKDGDSNFDISAANLADGSSPASPILVHFGVDVDPAFLTSQHELHESVDYENAIALFNYKSGERVIFMSEMDMNRERIATYPDRFALIIRPLEPMQMGNRHIVVLKNDLRDVDGNAFESPPAFAALRDGVLTANEEVEAIREKYEGIFDFLEQKGHAREDLLLVWDFMVASEEFVLGSILSMRETALDLVQGTGLSYTIEGVDENPNENVLRIVWGEFEVPTFINDTHTFDYDTEHHPILQETNQTFPYTMVIPKMAETSDVPLPLVVFGHGLFGSGRDYLKGGVGRDIVQPAAQDYGMVIIATDWIGLSTGDMNIIITEIIKDVNRIGLVTDRLQQSLINNLTLTELAVGNLNDDPQVQVNGHAPIDADTVYYYGVSLGGIQGTSFMSLSNRIERGVAAVPGSVWSNMLPRSSNWPAIKIFVDSEYPDPLVQQIGTGFIQSRFDHSDPINLSQLLFNMPLDDAPAGRAVLLQESIGDSQVPNMTTEMLARGAGFKVMTPSINRPFDLEEISSPSTESALVQYYLVDLVDADPPPESNIPPNSDNGAHSEMCFMPHTFQQVFGFLIDEELVQYCEGPCNPD